MINVIKDQDKEEALLRDEKLIKIPYDEAKKVQLLMKFTNLQQAYHKQQEEKEAQLKKLYKKIYTRSTTIKKKLHKIHTN